jgi:Short C-terminal domain
MLRRRRPLLRTAAVGGVAYAAGSHMARKSAEQSQMEAQQNAQIADLQQQQDMQQQAAAAPPVYQQPAPPAYQQPVAPPPAYQQPAPPAYQQPLAPPAAAEPSSSMEPDTLEQLKRLGELRDAKVLTDAEFEAAKQKILSQL